MTTTSVKRTSVNLHVHGIHALDIVTTHPAFLPAASDFSTKSCLTVECTDIEGYWCMSRNLLCKPEADGWLVFLKRLNGRLLFDRTWTEYETGFGNPKKDFWLGLDKLHQITSAGIKFKFRVELGSWDGEIEWAEYTDFSVGNSSSNYQLQLSGYSGNTTIDAMNPDNAEWANNGQYFSTKDRDNDNYPWNCAVKYAGGGGWWYNSCSNFFPTGSYGNFKDGRSKYMSWKNAFGGNYMGLKSVVLKIKSIN